VRHRTSCKTFFIWFLSCCFPLPLTNGIDTSRAPSVSQYVPPRALTFFIFRRSSLMKRALPLPASCLASVSGFSDHYSCLRVLCFVKRLSTVCASMWMHSRTHPQQRASGWSRHSGCLDEFSPRPSYKSPPAKIQGVPCWFFSVPFGPKTNSIFFSYYSHAFMTVI